AAVAVIVGVAAVVRVAGGAEAAAAGFLVAAHREQPVQHRHLRPHAVVRLAHHDAARPVEHLVAHHHVPPHRQAVHEAAGRVGAIPLAAAMCATAAGTASGSAFGCQAQLSTKRPPAAGTPSSSSVFQSPSAWQGWSTVDSRLISGTGQTAAMVWNAASARSAA